MEFKISESVSNCIACGADRLDATTMSDVRRCLACGLLFRSPRPTQAEISESYNQGSNYQRWATEEALREPMWQRRLDLLRKYRPGPHLLDAGTGDGRFLESAARAGFKAEGTEISETGAAIARERGYAVATGQFSTMELPNAPYDVVTAWHVLEHVPDPGAFLRRAWTILRPGGILVVAVPNESRALLKSRLGLEKGHPLGSMVYGGEIHLSHFQPATLIASVQRAGFEDIELGIDQAFHQVKLKPRVLHLANRILNRLFRWHLAPAMFVVCRRPF